MKNAMIPINSKTIFSHDWSFFEKLGFSKTEENLILPDGWRVIKEKFKPHRLISLLPRDAYCRCVAIWCTKEGIAQNVVLTARYYIRSQYRNKKFVFISVHDKKMNIPLFITNICQKGSVEEWENFKKCSEFLKSNYPDVDDPTAYWQD